MACEAGGPPDDSEVQDATGRTHVMGSDPAPSMMTAQEAESLDWDPRISFDLRVVDTRDVEVRDADARDVDAGAVGDDLPTESEPLEPVIAPVRVAWPSFTDVTAEAGVLYVQGPPHLDTDDSFYVQHGFANEEEWFSGGAAAADYDGDGWVDLYVTRLDDTDILFRNRGDGTFDDVTAEAGLDGFAVASNGAGFADVDADGDPDLYVTTLGEDRFYLFINDEGVFVDETVARGAGVDDGFWRGGYGVSFADYDRDGWLDLHTTDVRWDMGGAGRSHARLLRNRGAEGLAGHFEDVTDAAGVSVEFEEDGFWRTLAYTSTFSDLDGDGYPDLLVASDYGSSRLFWNDGDGTFTDGTDAAGVGTDDFGMGSSVGDYDGDGLLDWFVTSIYDYAVAAEASGNRLYRNEGDRTFADHTDVAGVRDGGWGWGTTFFDVDNDGDLDLVATNGYRRSSEPEFAAFVTDPNVLWINDGSGGMREEAADAGIADVDDGRGLLVFDYDRDGDQDLFIVSHAGAPRLYRNDSVEGAGWLQVRLAGTTANREGIGARIELQLEADGPVLVREMRASSNYLGQNETVVHFGLGAHRGGIHRIEITWPTPGVPRTQVLHDVAADQRLVVQQPD